MPATGTLQSVAPIRQFATSRSRAWPAPTGTRSRREHVTDVVQGTSEPPRAPRPDHPGFRYASSGRLTW